MEFGSRDLFNDSSKQNAQLGCLVTIIVKYQPMTVSEGRLQIVRSILHALIVDLSLVIKNSKLTDLSLLTYPEGC